MGFLNRTGAEIVVNFIKNTPQNFFRTEKIPKVPSSAIKSPFQSGLPGACYRKMPKSVLKKEKCFDFAIESSIDFKKGQILKKSGKKLFCSQEGMG